MDCPEIGFCSKVLCSGWRCFLQPIYIYICPTWTRLRFLFPALSQHCCCVMHWLPEHLSSGPKNQVRAMHCFNYFLLVWSGGYLVWWALLQTLALINTTLRTSCTSTGMVELSTCVAGSWYNTVASIYNYERKLLDVDYPVFFSSDGNYLHKFQFNPRTEVSLKMYT